MSKILFLLGVSLFLYYLFNQTTASAWLMLPAITMMLPFVWFEKPSAPEPLTQDADIDVVENFAHISPDIKDFASNCEDWEYGCYTIYHDELLPKIKAIELISKDTASGIESRRARISNIIDELTWMFDDFLHFDNFTIDKLCEQDSRYSKVLEEDISIDSTIFNRRFSITVSAQVLFGIHDQQSGYTFLTCKDETELHWFFLVKHHDEVVFMVDCLTHETDINIGIIPTFDFANPQVAMSLLWVEALHRIIKISEVVEENVG